MPIFSTRLVKSAVTFLCMAGPCSGVSALDRAAPAVVSMARATPEDDGGLPSGGSDLFRTRMLPWRAPARPIVQTTTVINSSAPAPVFISSPFGWRSDPIKGIRRSHAGIDLPGRAGTPIYATGAGTVSFAGWMGGYGNLVQIDHAGGVRTRYGHLSRLLVVGGAPVAQGDVIGQMGATGRSTGSHLHYEVRVRGVPMNPLAYIGQTAPTYYETMWTPEVPVVARWAGWQGLQSLDSLPAAKIP